VVKEKKSGIPRFRDRAIKERRYRCLEGTEPVGKKLRSRKIPGRNCSNTKISGRGGSGGEGQTGHYRPYSSKERISSEKRRGGDTLSEEVFLMGVEDLQGNKGNGKGEEYRHLWT